MYIYICIYSCINMYLQIVIADKVEAREALPLLLEKVGERLLAPLQLVEDGLEIIGQIGDPA